FEHRLVLGEQFLQIHFQGKLGDQDYSSIGLLGLNRAAGEFVEFWADSLGNAHYISTKQYEVTGDSIRLKSEFRHPFSGEVSYMSSLYTLKSNTELSHRVVRTGPDGTETAIKATNFTKA